MFARWQGSTVGLLVIDSADSAAARHICHISPRVCTLFHKLKYRISLHINVRAEPSYHPLPMTNKVRDSKLVLLRSTCPRLITIVISGRCDCVERPGVDRIASTLSLLCLMLKNQSPLVHENSVGWAYGDKSSRMNYDSPVSNTGYPYTPLHVDSSVAVDLNTPLKELNGIPFPCGHQWIEVAGQVPGRYLPHRAIKHPFTQNERLHPIRHSQRICCHRRDLLSPLSAPQLVPARQRRR